MKYQKYDYKSYTIHTINTDKFKNGIIEFSFRNNIDRDSVLDLNMVVGLLGYSSNKYPRNKYLVMEKENLYNFNFRGISTRVGNTHLINFVGNFLDPKYCDKGYINDVVNFMFELIYNPNIKDDEFEADSFKIIKNDTKAMIDTLDENSNRHAFYNAAQALDKDNSVAINFDGDYESLELITPSSLYKTYKKLIEEFHLDIYVVGNFKMDNIINLINKKMNLKSVKNYEVSLFNDIDKRSKPLEVVEKTNYEQAKLLMYYNVIGLTEYEKNVVVYLYNYLLGGGSLTSKLALLLREKNSLCYSTSSMYQKFDNLLVLYTGLDYVNYKKGVKLSKQAIKEMKMGDFTDKELNEAKVALVSSAKISQDSIGGVLSDRFIHNIAGTPIVDDFVKLVKKVTKEEVVEVANKVKLNLVYFMSNEGAE